MNFLFVGGCSQWCEKNHSAAIIELKNQGLPVSVLAICDPINPYMEKGKHNLEQILQQDRPKWIDSSRFTSSQLVEFLNLIHSKNKIDGIKKCLFLHYLR